MFFGKRFSGYHESSLSGLEILVLSLIKNNPKITGYEITQKINRKFKPMWKASAGTIYPLLDRLLKSQFVAVDEITDENNRQKKIYTITDKGINELRKSLKGNFEPSVNTLGKFIRTILQGIKVDADFDALFSCFPFCEHFPEQKPKIDEEDLSRENIENIEKIISNLKHRKEQLQRRIKIVEQEIDYYEDILEKVKKNREDKAKPIPIVDDDEEFENF